MLQCFKIKLRHESVHLYFTTSLRIVIPLMSRPHLAFHRIRNEKSSHVRITYSFSERRTFPEAYRVRQKACHLRKTRIMERFQHQTTSTRI